MSTYHDASVAVVKDGELQILLEAERYTHEKHSMMYKECLDELDKYNNNHFENVTLTGLAGLGKDSTHHLYHAFQGFYDSGFKEAVCVIVDGMGSEVQLHPPYFEEGSYGRECISIYKLSYPTNCTLIHLSLIHI